jgi:hypothetical protein
MDYIGLSGSGELEDHITCIVNWKKQPKICFMIGVQNIVNI